MKGWMGKCDKVTIISSICNKMITAEPRKSM